MKEEFEKLEAELAAMRPTRLSPALARNIDAELSAAQASPAPGSPPGSPSVSGRGNWLLASAMVCGAVAAVVIVTLIVVDPAVPARADVGAPPATAAVPAKPPTPPSPDRAFLSTQASVAWQN